MVPVRVRPERVRRMPPRGKRVATARAWDEEGVFSARRRWARSLSVSAIVTIERGHRGMREVNEIFLD